MLLPAQDAAGVCDAVLQPFAPTAMPSFAEPSSDGILCPDRLIGYVLCWSALVDIQDHNSHPKVMCNSSSMSRFTLKINLLVDQDRDLAPVQVAPPSANGDVECERGWCSVRRVGRRSSSDRGWLSPSHTPQFHDFLGASSRRFMASL